MRYKNKKCECCDILVRDRFCIKHFKQNRLENGLCTYCGNKNDTNFKLCSKCARDRSEKSKKRYNKIKEHERYLKRKKQILLNNQKYKAKRYKNDIQFRIIENIKNRFRYFLRKAKTSKNNKFSELLGCDQDTFFTHIESQFSENMNWDNYGQEWHIDHIIPISFFDMKNEIHIKLCNNFQNLRPLSAKDNIEKGNKIIEKDIDNLIFWLDDGAYILEI